MHSMSGLTDKPFPGIFLPHARIRVRFSDIHDLTYPPVPHGTPPEVPPMYRFFIRRNPIPTHGRQKILASAVVAIVVLSAAMIVFQTDDTHHDSSFTIIHTNDTHCFYDGDGGVGRMIAA